MWRDHNGRLWYVMSVAEPNALRYVVVQRKHATVTQCKEAGLSGDFGSQQAAQTALDVYAVQHQWAQLAQAWPGEQHEGGEKR